MKIVRPKISNKEPKRYRFDELENGDLFMFYYSMGGLFMKGEQDGEPCVTDLETGETVALLNASDLAVVKIHSLTIFSIEEKENKNGQSMG